jgi:hypothetical protein
MSRSIDLPVFGITLTLDSGGGGNIASFLHEDDAPGGYNAAMDAIESLVLAHACAGIDVESPAYLEGIETAVQACASNL